MSSIHWIKQLFLYGLGGGITTVTGYLLFALLLFLGVDYRLALAADYILGIIIGYLINRNIVFRSDMDHRKGIGYYIILYVVSFLFNWLLLSLLLRLIPSVLMAQAIALAVVTFSNYVILKYCIFSYRRGVSNA